MIVCWQQVPIARARGPSPRQQQPGSAICGVVVGLVDVIANDAEHEAVSTTLLSITLCCEPAAMCRTF
jgi:hypothetical protein